jgi:peptide/nickel transport system permease protein
MGRSGWLAARLLQIVPTFLLIGLVVFVLARLLPGNAVEAMLGDRGTDAAVASLTHQLGLDQSMGMQLLTFLGSAVHGNFGTSLSFHIPVSRLIAERLPVTLMLTGMAVLIAMVLALPAAFAAALQANRWPDLLIRGLSQIGLSSPIF